RPIVGEQKYRPTVLLAQPLGFTEVLGPADLVERALFLRRLPGFNSFADPCCITFVGRRLSAPRRRTDTGYNNERYDSQFHKAPPSWSLFVQRRRNFRQWPKRRTLERPWRSRRDRATSRRTGIVSIDPRRRTRRELVRDCQRLGIGLPAFSPSSG